MRASLLALVSLVSLSALTGVAAADDQFHPVPGAPGLELRVVAYGRGVHGEMTVELNHRGGAEATFIASGLYFLPDDPSGDPPQRLVFAGHSQRYWTGIFDGIDCCVTPVLTLEETLANEQIRAREMVLEVDGVAQFAPPWKLRGVAGAAATPAPHAGEHSAEVLRAAGYAEAEIEALRQARVI